MSNEQSPYRGGIASALAGALSPKRVHGLWFSEKSITLDGYVFEECRFDKCTLHVNNAENVTLLRCFVSDDSHFTFGQSSLSAIKLFNCKQPWYYENAPYLVPERDSQGRITLNNNYLSGLAGLLGTTNG